MDLKDPWIGFLTCILKKRGYTNNVTVTLYYFICCNSAIIKMGCMSFEIALLVSVHSFTYDTVCLSLSIPGKVDRQCWCTVKWAFPALHQPWSPTPWSSCVGPWMWRCPTLGSDEPSSIPTTASWSSCRPTTASLTQGQARHVQKYNWMFLVSVNWIRVLFNFVLFIS